MKSKKRLANKEKDPGLEAWQGIVDIIKAKHLNSQQIMHIATDLQIAAHSMAVGAAVKQFSDGILSHLDQTQNPSREQFKKQREQEEGKIRVKPE